MISAPALKLGVSLSGPHSRHGVIYSILIFSAVFCLASSLYLPWPMAHGPWPRLLILTYEEHITIKNLGSNNQPVSRE